MPRRSSHHPRASPFDTTRPATFVGSELVPPITDPAVAKHWLLSPHSTFRFGLQESKCWFFQVFFRFFFFFCLFSFTLQVHVTELGLNAPIISDGIGATV